MAVTIGAIAVLTVACGGDDEPAAEGGGDTTSPAAEPQDDPASEAGGGEPVEGGGANTATVTIGDETFEFEMVACVAIGGFLGGGGFATDGTDIDLEIDIPPPDDAESVPYIRVEDDREDVPKDWRAGGDTAETFPPVTEEQSQVGDYRTDGQTAEGTATFAETHGALLPDGEVVTAEGSFRITCE